MPSSSLGSTVHVRPGERCEKRGGPYAPYFFLSLIFTTALHMSKPLTHTVIPPVRVTSPEKVDGFRTKYPPVEAYETGMMKVSGLHTIYWEVSGNPDGKPCIILHGGPGGGCPPGYRQYFDPSKYRIVMFDQRGAGKSKPLAELRENTTWDLIADIEKLREHLNIDKWVVFGGSWGSTLSLAYSQAHPERTKALVLRGIFMCRHEEVQFFYQDGSSWIFPEAFEVYKNFIPEAERDDLVGA